MKIIQAESSTCIHFHQGLGDRGVKVSPLPSWERCSIIKLKELFLGSCPPQSHVGEAGRGGPCSPSGKEERRLVPAYPKMSEIAAL